MEPLSGLPGGAPLRPNPFAEITSRGALPIPPQPDFRALSNDQLADFGFAQELARLLRAGEMDAAVALCDGREAERVTAVIGRTDIEPRLVVALGERLVESLMDKRDSMDGQIAALASNVMVFQSVLLGGHFADVPDAEMALRRSRVFEIAADFVSAAAQRVRPDDVRSPYLIAPFPRFALAFDRPVQAADGAEIRSLWVDAERDEWLVYARVFIRRSHPERSAETVLSIGIDIAEGVLTAPSIDQTMQRLRDAYGAMEKPFDEEAHRKAMLPGNEAVAFTPLARIAVGFVLLLNSRAVEAAPDGARSAAVREEDIDGDGPRSRRPRYRVVVPPKRSARSLLAAVRRGEDVRDRRPHWVRQHPRDLGGGRIVSVRRHTRGGDPSRYLPLYELRPPNGRSGDPQGANASGL